jgi:hypothetical protein
VQVLSSHPGEQAAQSRVIPTMRTASACLQVTLHACSKTHLQAKAASEPAPTAEALHLCSSLAMVAADGAHI